MVDSLAVDRVVYHTLADRNEIPVDADISVCDDSYMDLAEAGDYVEVRLVVVDYNLAVECVPHPVGMAIMVADYWMKEHVNVAHQPATSQ